ncbi:MAG TPA: M48 family metallopeptidase [Polyangiaceae bacterium]|nr:M48 family metallopeptidase [Polyangiaceae bacterium]
MSRASATVPSPRSMALRAAVLLLAWAGFHVLGLTLCLSLLWIPWAQVAYGSGPDLGGCLAFLGAFWILWGLRPRFERNKDREQPLSSECHPKLHALVADVARRSGHPVPHELHLIPYANAYAARRGAFLGRGRSMVGIGLPYLAWLDQPAVEAVIAHELGHHLSGDVRLGPWVHRTRNLMGRALDHLEGSGFWLDLPFVGYARAFLHYSLSVSRAQELAADAISAKVAGAGAAARALVTTDERSGVWEAYLQTEIVPMLQAGFLPQLLLGFRHFEAALADTRKQREKPTDVVKQSQKASRYDTHPLLEERLSALGVTRQPAVEASGALELLEATGEAEEYVLRRMLVHEARPLRALAWESAGTELWLPRFRERLEPHANVLAKVTPEQLPTLLTRIDEWADRLRTGLALFSPEAKRRHVIMLFGTWLAVHLADGGFELEALPGWPVRAVRSELTVEPFGEVAALFEGKLESARWLERCSQIRQASLAATPASA